MSKHRSSWSFICLNQRKIANEETKKKNLVGVKKETNYSNYSFNILLEHDTNNAKYVLCCQRSL
jgi:hypothetical protein